MKKLDICGNGLLPVGTPTTYPVADAKKGKGKKSSRVPVDGKEDEEDAKEESLKHIKASGKKGK